MANAFKTACFIHEGPESYPDAALDSFITAVSNWTYYSNSTVSIIRTFPLAPNLISVSFPNCNFLGYNAFHRCSSLYYIYLMSTSVCRMQFSTSTTSPFNNTRISSTAGYIYVPTSLVTQYKNNWTYYSNRIYGLG